jgi:predicted dehydrogenase
MTALHNIEAEDTLVATLEFASGAVGTFEATTAAYPGYNRRVELTGSQGTVILENSSVIQADVQSNAEMLSRPATDIKAESATSAVVSDISGHKRLLENFVQAILTNSELACDGREGRRSLELVESLYQAAETGSAIELKNRQL